ncbi:hypothetical protein SAMD00020551_3339 [Mesobacillus selenatarsenatis SF-1]|uniref:Uncharacterized protein n=1 Tax=Mesobacillus selenatarsenatis (strain DSM 18680 / JCM 14380 / FERM P-15431 / SF-1) TaxID=1321606 RepID=A0A0A8X5G6_MESS1|nr:hypothetical protein SAMD00020551_3339 [Mesobacillus selenatarsenatis SF-1]
MTSWAGPKRLEELGAQLDKRLEGLGAGAGQFSKEKSKKPHFLFGSEGVTNL